MTREEFINTAEDCGYTGAELKRLLEMHDDLGMPFDKIPLVLHNVD